MRQLEVLAQGTGDTKSAAAAAANAGAGFRPEQFENCSAVISPETPADRRPDPASKVIPPRHAYRSRRYIARISRRRGFLPIAREGPRRGTTDRGFDVARSRRVFSDRRVVLRDCDRHPPTGRPKTVPQSHPERADTVSTQFITSFPSSTRFSSGACQTAADLASFHPYSDFLGGEHCMSRTRLFRSARAVFIGRIAARDCVARPSTSRHSRGQQHAL